MAGDAGAPGGNGAAGAALQVAVSIDVDDSPLTDTQIAQALHRLLVESGRVDGVLAVSVIDDAAMHVLNREQLDHDWPTDVISFNYQDNGPDAPPQSIDGEVIVNADHAVRSGPGHGLSPADELLLYCIHGTLHILGYDDTTDAGRAEMEHVQTDWLDRLRAV